MGEPEPLTTIAKVLPVGQHVPAFHVALLMVDLGESSRSPGVRAGRWFLNAPQAEVGDGGICGLHIAFKQ